MSKPKFLFSHFMQSPRTIWLPLYHIEGGCKVSNIWRPGGRGLVRSSPKDKWIIIFHQEKHFVSDIVSETLVIGLIDGFADRIKTIFTKLIKMHFISSRLLKFKNT